MFALARIMRNRAACGKDDSPRAALQRRNPARHPRGAQNFPCKNSAPAKVKENENFLLRKCAAGGRVPVREDGRDQ
jgi:hypothetical protein